jgi:hypothetical protein
VYNNTQAEMVDAVVMGFRDEGIEVIILFADGSKQRIIVPFDVVKGMLHAYENSKQ